MNGTNTSKLVVVRENRRFPSGSSWKMFDNKLLFFMMTLGFVLLLSVLKITEQAKKIGELEAFIR